MPTKIPGAARALIVVALFATGCSDETPTSYTEPMEPLAINAQLTAPAYQVVIGTTNRIEEVSLPPEVSAYSEPFVILVTDHNGQGVSGAHLSITGYAEGYDMGQWLGGEPVSSVVEPSNTDYSWPPCRNEDSNHNGHLDEGEDLNGNGTLEPGNVIAAPTELTTDSDGFAFFSVTYYKVYALWTQLHLTVQLTNTPFANTLERMLMINVEDIPFEGAASPWGTSLSCYR